MGTHLGMILEAAVELGDIPLVTVDRGITKLEMVGKKMSDVCHEGDYTLRPVLVENGFS
jgi:hypothetical protein